MDVLFLLIPLSVVLAVAIGAAFWLAVEAGQFEDLEGPGLSVVVDDDRPPIRAEAPAARGAPPLPPKSAPPRHPGMSGQQLRRVLDCIETRLAEPLRIRHLAQQAALSPFHFSRLFRRATGHSPHQYLTLRRMEKAKLLLAGSDLPIAAVASAVGYLTQAHFTSAFGRHAGLTPRAYRACRRPAPPLPAAPRDATA
jgi:cbb3-type cytochrome oxidase maturation protein